MPVSIMKLENGGFALAGGFLKDEEAWIATSEIVILDNYPFVQLKRTSAGLRRLVGASLHHNGFLDEFLALRDEHCLDLIKNQCDRFDEASKRQFDGPKIITITAPKFSPWEAPININVAFEKSAKTLLSVNLRSEAIMYIIQGIRATEGKGARWNKRPISQQPHIAFGQWNNQRESIMIKYSDEEGRRRTKCCKPRIMDEQHIMTAVKQLQSFYEHNNTEDIDEKNNNEDTDEDDSNMDMGDGLQVVGEPIDRKATGA